MMTLMINILVTSAFIGSAAFVFRYMRVKWFTSTEGRVTMFLFLALLTVFALAVVGTWTSNDYPFRTAVRFIAYAGTNALIWSAYILLITDQRRGRRQGRRHRGSTVANG